MNKELIERLEINMENAKMLGRIEGIVSNLRLYSDQFESEPIKSYFENELKRIVESVNNIKL
jgi:phosphoglucomutase